MKTETFAPNNALWHMSTISTYLNGDYCNPSRACEVAVNIIRSIRDPTLTIGELRKYESIVQRAYFMFEKGYQQFMSANKVLKGLNISYYKIKSQKQEIDQIADELITRLYPEKVEGIERKVA